MAVDRTTKEYHKEQYAKYGKEWYQKNRLRHNLNQKRSRNNLINSHLLRGCRYRATKVGLDFDLNQEDIVVPEVCPILKTPFIIGTWSAASVDRIDNTKGYIKDNVQVISRRANTMKGDCTPEQLLLFAKWINNKYTENQMKCPNINSK